jgi:SIR2-like domain
MFRILNSDQIPYADQAARLFNFTGVQPENMGVQRIVPFLGAGVSLSGRDRPISTIGPSAGVDLQPLLQKLGLKGSARAFLEIAVLLARLIQGYEDQRPASATDDFDVFVKRLQQDSYPPSAGELAQLFSDLANYTTFTNIVKRLRKQFPTEKFESSEAEQVRALKLLAESTGIANPPDVLTNITSYFESVSGRDSLWDNLKSVISSKDRPTRTHEMLATAAKCHLSQKRTRDYLIITTNYDCLMEKALDDLSVPYVVLLTRKSDQKVIARFSEKIPDYQWYEDQNNKGETNGKLAKDFFLEKSSLGNLVVISKIHGCLNQKLKREEADGVIISDNDYINYIKQMGQGNSLIPSYVNTLMNNKPFLFLGYSLNDWNIRSIFETMREKRSQFGGVQDMSVMYEVSDFEEVFFQRNDVLIFKTDLNSFVDGVGRHVPDELRRNFSS